MILELLTVVTSNSSILSIWVFSLIATTLLNKNNGKFIYLLEHLTMESHINLDWQCGLLHHKICQTADFANDFRVQVAICGTGERGKLTLYCKLEVDYDWLGKCDDLDDSFESIHNSFESIPKVLLELKSNISSHCILKLGWDDIFTMPIALIRNFTVE